MLKNLATGESFQASTFHPDLWESTTRASGQQVVPTWLLPLSLKEVKPNTVLANVKKLITRTLIKLNSLVTPPFHSNIGQKAKSLKPLQDRSLRY